MSKPFDATFKELVQLGPPDWAALVGAKARSVEVVDADVSTVTAAADKVLLVRSDAGDYIQHFDFQGSPDASVPRRSHLYSTVLEGRHGLPVESVVFMLRPEANLRAINGVYERRLPGEVEPYLRFRYKVIRVWELPVESVLGAGVSVLPLAPITAVGQNEVAAVIERMKERLEGEVEEETAGVLWIATGVLLSLRYGRGLIESLLQGVRGMKESTMYQAIVEEGRLQELREDIRRLGELKFRSPPPAEVQTTLEGVQDLEQLRRLLDRILTTSGWDELIVPAPQ